MVKWSSGQVFKRDGQILTLKCLYIRLYYSVYCEPSGQVVKRDGVGHSPRKEFMVQLQTFTTSDCLLKNNCFDNN